MNYHLTKNSGLIQNVAAMDNLLKAQLPVITELVAVDPLPASPKLISEIKHH